MAKIENRAGKPGRCRGLHIVRGDFLCSASQNHCSFIPPRRFPKSTPLRWVSICRSCLCAGVHRAQQHDPRPVARADIDGEAAVADDDEHGHGQKTEEYLQQRVFQTRDVRGALVRRDHHGVQQRASFCAIWTGAMPRRHLPEARDLTIGRDLCIITTKSLIFCEICPPASGDREESNVTYTVDDTMKKLLSAPEAVAVLERFFPKILKNPALQMTAAMTLRQVAGFAQSGLTADSLAEIDAQLRALPSSDA